MKSFSFFSISFFWMGSHENFCLIKWMEWSWTSELVQWGLPACKRIGPDMKSTCTKWCGCKPDGKRLLTAVSTWKTAQTFLGFKVHLTQVTGKTKREKKERPTSKGKKKGFPLKSSCPDVAWAANTNNTKQLRFAKNQTKAEFSKIQSIFRAKRGRGAIFVAYLQLELVRSSHPFPIFSSLTELLSMCSTLENAAYCFSLWSSDLSGNLLLQLSNTFQLFSISLIWFPSWAITHFLSIQMSQIRPFSLKYSRLGWSKSL